MRKLRSARDHLLSSHLKITADKLLTFAEKGSVIRYPRADHQNRDFGVTYTAHLILTDFTGDPLDVFFVALAWMAVEMPGAKPDALSFHVDVIDHKKVDLSLMIELTEAVGVAAVTGGTSLTSTPDPDAMRIGLFGVE